jgi:GTP-binding protein EngB required for normal cell division
MARPLIFLLLLAIASAQRPHRDPLEDDKPESARLKRSQIVEILKMDRAKSVEDAAQMVKLSEELRDELEKDDKSVLSVTSMKKAEEIEKLAKRIRGRMRRY